MSTDDGRWCADASRSMGAVHIFDGGSGEFCRCLKVQGFIVRLEEPPDDEPGAVALMEENMRLRSAP